MHELFPDWIRTLNPDHDLSSLPLTKWWEAIDAFIADAKALQIVELTRSAHQRSSADFDAVWRAHLKEHDDLSPLRGEDRHVAVLAGIALIHASDAGENRDVARSARRCATQNGWEPALADVAFSADDMNSAAADVRVLTSWATPRRSNVTMKNISDHMPPSDSPATGANMNAVVEQLVASVNDALQRTSQAVARVAADRERVLLEQSDVLVWLLSGYSRLTGGPWKALSPTTAAVCAAVELRCLSRFVLGRPDAPALIAQAVAGAGKESKTETEPARLAEIVSRADLASLEAVSDLAPVCSQLAQGAALDSADDVVVMGARVHDELALLEALGR